MMKTVLRALTLLILLLALAVPALAEEALPADIAAYFAQESRSGYTLTDHCQIEDYFFVATRDEDGMNALFGFRADDGGWAYWLKTEKGVPQGEGTLTVHNAQGSYRLVDEKYYALPTLSVGMLETKFGGEYIEADADYEFRDGQWYLETMSRITSPEYWITFYEDTLTYYGEYEAFRPDGALRATVQRDLRYASLDTIPKTYARARETLTIAPTLPASAELQAQNIKFSGGRKYDVYSAPSTMSWRGSNGKAAVSTNSWIQVFGREGDWILIQYSIDAEKYRFGYISASSLPRNASVPALRFSETLAYLTQAVQVTDDPLYSQSTMLTLPEGAPVTWLATLGEWAYIESSTGDHLRGFVPASSLRTDRVFDLMNHPRDDGRVVYMGEMSVGTDGSFFLSASPIAVAAETLCVVDTYSGALIAQISKDYYGSFSVTGYLTVGCTSVTLVPYDGNGAEIAAGRVEIAW